MKKPRTKGGTGLGLSICSKQVSRASACRQTGSHIYYAAASPPKCPFRHAMR